VIFQQNPCGKVNKSMWKEKSEKRLLITVKQPTFFSTAKMPASGGFSRLFHKIFSYGYYYEEIKKID